MTICHELGHALMSASASEFKPVARLKALEGKCCATPTLANARLFVRNNEGALAAFDLRPAVQ